MTPIASRPMWSRLGEIAGLVATPLAPSHYLALVNPLWATHTLEARVESTRDETPDVRTLQLRVGRAWRPHRAGQYVHVGAAIDGRKITRTYSISSSPDRAERSIDITVKIIPEGRMSRFLARDVRPGTVLSLSPPRGEFVLPDPAPERLLLVTAGSGITPVMAMLRTLALRAAMPEVTHIHYAPDARQVIFANELQTLAATSPTYRFAPVHTRGSGDRHFSVRQLDTLCRDWRERGTWACGPASLLAALGSCFETAGLAHRLHIERFHLAPMKLPVGSAGGRVRLRVSGLEVKAEASKTLLQVAEEAGVNALYGCRMGNCRTCDVTMVSGCARDFRTGQVIEQPGARIQPCVFGAAGDLEINL